MKPLEQLTEFDPDLTHNSYVNKEAAEQRLLVYDSKEKAYRDSDGYLIRDKYGQPL